MTAGLKIAVFILLFKWTQGLFVRVDMPLLLSVLQWLAVLSVLFGNIIALLQPDIRRMLLFSSVAHSGYLLMIVISGQMGASVASSALFYYLMVYVMMIVGIFMSLRPFEKENQYEVSLQQLCSQASQNPINAFFITVFLFCLAGLPPTGGFIAKLFLLQVLMDQGFFMDVFMVYFRFKYWFILLLKTCCFNVHGESKPSCSSCFL